MPEDFDGFVQMESAEYTVEVQAVVRPDAATRRRTPTEPCCSLGPKILIPLKNEILVEARDEDYVCVSRPLLTLKQLVERHPLREFPLAVRILDWNEVTLLILSLLHAAFAAAVSVTAIIRSALDYVELYSAIGIASNVTEIM